MRVCIIHVCIYRWSGEERPCQSLVQRPLSLSFSLSLPQPKLFRIPFALSCPTEISVSLRASIDRDLAQSALRVCVYTLGFETIL